MKKSIVIILAFLMLLSVAACDKADNSVSETTATTSATAPSDENPQPPEPTLGNLAEGVDKALGQEIMTLIDTHYNLSMSGFFSGKEIDYADTENVIEVSGKHYMPVTIEGMPDYKSLENVIKSTYDDNAATYFLEYYCYGEPLYSELNGQLVMRWHTFFSGVWDRDEEWSEYTIEKIEIDGDKGSVTFLVTYPEVHGSIAYYVDSEGNKTPDDRRYNRERIEVPITLCDGGWRLTSITVFYGYEHFLVEE